MIDINFIRQNPDFLKKVLINRQKNPELIDKLLEVDETYRKILHNVESLSCQQNKLSKKIKGKPSQEQIEKAVLIKQKLQKIKDKLNKKELEVKSILEQIPNIPLDDVPVGKDDKENIVIKTYGKPKNFDFKILDHVDLGEKLNIIDVKKAGDLSGSRFGYFKNQAALLEMALMFYSFKKLVNKGWKAMIPPAMIKSKTEWGCGYADNKNLFNAYYSILDDDLIFISSSEHSVIPYHSNETLDKKILPIKYVNFSPCFRREAGTYGKDTRGMFRVHFFNKVEMNILSYPDYKISNDLFFEMLSEEEELVKDLGLPYQVKNCCTGDLPQPNKIMYDLETWFPGQNAYRETHSCSNCGDYQARRLNIKTKIEGKTEFVHTLNSTMVTDRIVLAILENYQQKDGSIIVPRILQELVGKDIIKV